MTGSGPRRPSSRVALLASGTFFCAYLAFQTVYPALSWFLPGYDHFTWHMYSGREMAPRFFVILTDGTQRDVANPTKVGAGVRLLSTSIDQRTVIPAWLCANWGGVSAVMTIDRARGREEVTSCRSAGR